PLPPARQVAQREDAAHAVADEAHARPGEIGDARERRGQVALDVGVEGPRAPRPLAQAVPAQLEKEDVEARAREVAREGTVLRQIESEADCPKPVAADDSAASAVRELVHGEPNAVVGHYVVQALGVHGATSLTA